MIPAPRLEAEDLVALNPYPGLRPFRTEDSSLFFGRRQQIEELAALVEQRSFLAVVGDSGCGKSSLVLAGLLARLAGGVQGERRWLPVVMRPGAQPIATLAKRLAPVLGDRDFSPEVCEGSLHGHLRLGDLGLAESVRLASLAPGTRVMLVVDQFEEVFRLDEQDPDEARAFVKLILRAASDPGVPVTVLVTLRANEIGRCATFRDLPEAVCRGQFLVPKLTLGQRRETVVGPASLRNRAIAPRLVQRVLNDVHDDYDDLLVMQHALLRTWNDWARHGGEGSIDLEHYERIGTTREALSRHADEALASVEGLRPVVERVFQAITQHTAEGHAERRPLPLERLQKVVGGDGADVERVVHRFQASDVAFLVPDGSVVDIVHEALLRECKVIREWAVAEHEKKQMLLRLADAARRRRTGKGSLWQGEDLEEALEWQTSQQPGAAWAGLYLRGEDSSAWREVVDFLEDSRAAEARERGRKRSMQRNVRILWAVLAGMAVLGLLVFAYLNASRARQARSRELATKAVAEVRLNPALAARLAVEAERAGARGQVEQVFRQSLATLEIAHLERSWEGPPPLQAAGLSSDRSRLVVVAGGEAAILDAGTLEPTVEHIPTGPASDACMLEGAGRILTVTADGLARVWSAGEASGVSGAWTLGCGSDAITSVGVSKGGRWIALGCMNGTVRVFPAANPVAPSFEYPTAVRASPVTALAFSADASYLATGDAFGTIRIWKLGQASAPWMGPRPGEEKTWLLRHGERDAVRLIAFHPTDPRFLLTSGDDAKVAFWELDLRGRHLATASGRPVHKEIPQERIASMMGFAPRVDAPDQFVSISDKRVFFWANGRAAGRNTRGHDDWVLGVDTSSDGELALSASSDGTARIWSTGGGTPLTVLRHRSEVLRAFFGHDPGQLITASADGSVRVWRYSLPRVLDEGPGWMLDAAFEPLPPGDRAGGLLAVASQGALRVLRVQGGARQLVAKLPLPEGMDLVEGISWGAGRRLLGSASSSRWWPPPRPVVWDLTANEEVTPAWLKEWQTARFGSRGREFVASGSEGSAVWGLEALDAIGARPPPRVKLGSTPHEASALSEDGQWIATYGDGRLELWDRAHPDAPRLLEGHLGSVRSFRFSPDSRSLLTSSADGTARVWPVGPAPGLAARVFNAGQGRVLMTASFDGSGHRVIAGGADGSLYVWDVDGGKLLAQVRRHSETVNGIGVGPDGREILTASDDGTVQLGRCEVCDRSSQALEADLDRYAVLDRKGREDLEHEKERGRRLWGLLGPRAGP